ncbi:hypothetical protein QMG83_04250 [Salinibacterium sp. G-O1]|uniref:hypothetical protein n=1 Tax=Salinibacterium sp. G-O1 TaxID=3046208 RepID=UPI0024BB0D05|nr:hypothetical protein [Salinibacterium sp. G-O1]MDJ0334428.1 hypothetical protein [Salinibacterium sp. G-O1]
MTIFDSLVTLVADSTPTPLPAYEGDVNLITPGVVGFAVTFLIALATVFLLIDMTRRVRRVRYRNEVREQIAIEQAEEALAAADAERPSASGDETPKTPAG